MINTIKDSLSMSELRIFRAIYENGPISRVRLSEGLDLTRAAITMNLKRLSELNIIEETGKGNRQFGRGRKEILMSINPGAGFILSIHVALRYLTFGIVDLSGKIRAKKTRPFPIHSAPHQILEPLVGDISDLVQKTKINPEKIIGIGVGIPGIVDSQSGIALESTLEGWQGFDVRSYLQDHLGYVTHVENDVKALTLGEYYFGSAQNVRNLVCLWLEDGIGAGIINDGKLIRGVTASAGEIGFNEFILDMPVKKSILIVGQPRFWGDILCFANIQATIKRGLEGGWQSQLAADATLGEFVAAVENRDPLGFYIIRLISRIVGTVCCNLIYTFNPQLLLLSGPLFSRNSWLVDEVYEHINKGVLRSPIKAVQLKTSMLAEDGVTIGSAALIMENFFKGAEPKTFGV